MNVLKVVQGVFILVMLVLLASKPEVFAGENADKPVFHLRLKAHLFYPDTLHVKAMQPFILAIKNEDATPEEVESAALNIARIIGPRQTARLHINPLSKGRYCFYGAFHPQSALACVEVD